jgi:hypothetical protein
MCRDLTLFDLASAVLSVHAVEGSVERKEGRKKEEERHFLAYAWFLD